MMDLAIYGAGGFGKEILPLVDEINFRDPKFRFIGFFDDEIDKRQTNHYLGNIDVLNNWDRPLNLILAMGWSLVRLEAYRKITNPKIYFPNLISSKSLISNPSAVKFGKGVIIMQGANLTTDIQIDDFAVININATVGHDVSIGKFGSIMPSANLSGNVVLEENTFVGSGSTIIHGIRIGRNSVIGAGSVVIKNVAPNSVMAGVPAKLIRQTDGKS